ncbi:MAG: LTA synthase family protein [Clostridiales bacterium]|nr:LTA synthase family protein [Clostridiales bacterium]
MIIKQHTQKVILYFIGCIIYLEIVLHLLVFKEIDGKIIYPILFAIPLGLVFALLSSAFEPKVNKIIMWIITSIICLLFSVQLIYYHVFKVFFSFQTIGMAWDAFSNFNKDIYAAIKDNILGLLLVFMPLPMLYHLMKETLSYETIQGKEQGILFAGALVSHIIALLALFIFGTGAFSPYDLYHNNRVPELSGKQLGMVTMIRFDLSNLLSRDDELELTDISVMQQASKEESSSKENTSKSNKVASPTPSHETINNSTATPIPIDRSPNIMDIDFKALASQEANETIRTLHKYFDSVQPTNKNEYTGMFKGYNLIMIVAEGFSPYAVHKEKTPTLYKLVNEGFVFRNFYTALWQTSTSDGEFVALNSLIPIGTRSMYRTRNNLLPFSLGHQFNRIGVESKAYHNHTYTYYQRDKTHPNLGYKFKAIGNGLVLETANVWPASDLEMINATVDEYIREEQFHVYYLTVSGHMNYTFTGNSMSYRNKDEVADLPYSSDVRAYIACQMELDKALEALIKKLQEAGVADKTVIALSADHYPYGWEKEKLDELAAYTIEPNFEIYKNHFILWNSSMKNKIVVDKPASSMDILPTLLNLFGLKYDSRLLMGQDILSNSDPLVIFSNRSFITDKVMYNSETGKAILLTGEEVSDEYIDLYNKIIKNKFDVSESIVKYDYYRYVFPEY